MLSRTRHAARQLSAWLIFDVRQNMNLQRAIETSEQLRVEMEAIAPSELELPDPRHFASRVACSLASEHWAAARILLSANLLPSAVAVHRTQFEALVRSIWLLHAASESDVIKLISPLNSETEQAAKNSTGLQDMISEIKNKGPVEAYNALDRFRSNALKPINSYVHTGIHPMNRHATGYPEKLVIGVLQNANGIAVMTWMQKCILANRQDCQRKVLEIAARYPTCMPAPL